MRLLSPKCCQHCGQQPSSIALARLCDLNNLSGYHIAQGVGALGQLKFMANVVEH
jgi:hypothetical protein